MGLLTQTGQCQGVGSRRHSSCAPPPTPKSSPCPSSTIQLTWALFRPMPPLSMSPMLKPMCLSHTLLAGECQTGQCPCSDSSFVLCWFLPACLALLLENSVWSASAGPNFFCSQCNLHRLHHCGVSLVPNPQQCSTSIRHVHKPGVQRSNRQYCADDGNALHMQGSSGCRQVWPCPCCSWYSAVAKQACSGNGCGSCRRVSAAP